MSGGLSRLSLQCLCFRIGGPPSPIMKDKADAIRESPSTRAVRAGLCPLGARGRAYALNLAASASIAKAPKFIAIGKTRAKVYP